MRERHRTNRRARAAKRAGGNGQGPGRRGTTALGLIAAAAVVTGALVLAGVRSTSSAFTLNERVQGVASGLRCVVCQNLSVADSPTRTALAMRDDIGARLRRGQTPAEIRDFFVAKYGQWILLSPRASGLPLVAWIAPAVALAVGGIVLGSVLRRRRPVRGHSDPPPTPAESARIQRELQLLEEPD